VIAIPTGVRIMLATRPVDFRRGAHSLAALAAASLGQDPFDGALIVFRAKRADRVKILGEWAELDWFFHLVSLKHQQLLAWTLDQTVWILNACTTICRAWQKTGDRLVFARNLNDRAICPSPRPRRGRPLENFRLKRRRDNASNFISSTKPKTHFYNGPRRKPRVLVVENCTRTVKRKNAVRVNCQKVRGIAIYRYGSVRFNGGRSYQERLIPSHDGRPNRIFSPNQINAACKLNVIHSENDAFVFHIEGQN